MTVASTSSLRKRASIRSALSGGTASSSKLFTLATGGTGAFQVDTSGVILTVSSVISNTGTGNLSKVGAGTLTLSGNNASRVFSICTNTTVTIQGLTIANGYSTNGGGIYNDGGTLNLTNCVLKANKAQGANGYWSGGYPSGTPVGAARPGHGGALYNLGTVSATNCLFWTNTAAGGQFNWPSGIRAFTPLSVVDQSIE